VHLRRNRRRPGRRPAARTRQAPLPPAMALDERGEQREVRGEIGENVLEVALDGAGRAPASLVGGLGRVTPERKLTRHGVLDGLAMGEKGGRATARRG
jgi:hypothetical protein